MLEDYTIVVTNNQTSGRGQIDSSWESKPFKNLTFSIFTSFKSLEIKNQAYLNFAVSLAIFDTLKVLSVPNLHIKWPNDIMSANKKICGILIETTFKQQLVKNTVIGIGLNVNQEIFSEKLPNASSLKIIFKKEFDLEKILISIVDSLKIKINELEQKNLDSIQKEYHKALYKIGIPTTFKETRTGILFTGIIVGVSELGKIQIQKEDDSTNEYNIKEISFAKV